MPVVLVGGEKGGTGKTTLATNLAAMRAKEGRDVLLIDTDTQRSASYWVAARAGNPNVPRISCIQLYEPNLGLQVPDLAKRYDDVIIDAGGRDSPELRRGLVVAHRAYIPVQPSQFDVWTVPTLQEHLRSAKQFNSSLQAFLVLSRAPSHPSSREVEDVREALADKEDLPLARSIIRDRAAFRRASTAGMAVMEMPSADPKAVEEITALYREIYHGY